MYTVTPIPHPSTPCRKIDRFEARIGWHSGTELRLHYVIEGEISGFKIPRSVLPERRDRLWESTCLEVFVRAPGSPSYCEFNFAPSAAWAAYAFDGYRDGMKPLSIDPWPELRVQSKPHRFELAARIGGLADCLAVRGCKSLQVGIAAVVEEQDGRRSYWSLHHPSDRPDFHHPDSFALTLDFGDLEAGT